MMSVGRRLLAKVDRSAADGCRSWHGAVSRREPRIASGLFLGACLTNAGVAGIMACGVGAAASAGMPLKTIVYAVLFVGNAVAAGWAAGRIIALRRARRTPGGHAA